MIRSVRKVLVLGGGSAGFLAALAIKTKTPDVQVDMVRSPEIAIIGVGEATTVYIPKFLHGFLNLDIGEFYREANPSWKLGIRFLWGPRGAFNYTFQPQCCRFFVDLPLPAGYYCKDDFDDAIVGSSLMSADRAFLRDDNGFPIIGRDAAYHIENVSFVGYLEAVARRLGVTIREDTVEHVEQNEAGIASLKLASGESVSADLFVDCSGFRSLLLGQTFKEPFISFASSLYCDRAITGGWERDDEPVLPFTVAETMNAGWCWRIDHQHRVHRGYVHSSAFMSEEEARREFLAKNPKVKSTGVVKFRSGRHQRLWVKNVVSVGNSAGFVEPLESTGLHGIASHCQTLAETLSDSTIHRVTDSHVFQFNVTMARYWDSIRDFLAVHYKFNRKLDTPFWRACLADTELAGAKPIVEYFQENGPSLIAHDALVDRANPFQLEGYWTLLLGQNVPFDSPHEISAEDWEKWQNIRWHHRRAATNSLTALEAMAAIRRPEWRWDNEFYKDPPGSFCGLSGNKIL